MEEEKKRDKIHMIGGASLFTLFILVVLNIWFDSDILRNLGWTNLVFTMLMWVITKSYQNFNDKQ